jgi:hypothetical protein
MTDHIDVWRMSAGRPWQLEQTHDALLKHLKYSGELRFHLIESFLVKEFSEECVRWGKDHGYQIHEINPAKGQGYAMYHALHHVITSRYALKWEDDFRPEVDIPLDECVRIMDEFQHVNQICFNKRETMREKWCEDEQGEPFAWQKREDKFALSSGAMQTLTLKEKWWFGPALWRIDFIKPIFQYWTSNTHNLMNDRILLPMAGGVSTGHGATSQPEQNAIAEKIGCYIYGRIGDPRMSEHTGREDSIWAGRYQEMINRKGLRIISGAV